MEENKMKKHVTAVAILQIVFGAFNLIGGMAIGFIFKFAAEMAGDPTATTVLNIISVPLTIILCVFGVGMILGAIGLLTYKMWGKIVTLIFGAIGLLSVPLGTFKGVYIIWALVQPETNALFNKPATEVAQQ
jgi:hypothetical protein